MVQLLKTLAIDTSTGLGSVAIADGLQADGTAKILSRRVWRREKSHSEYLTAAIQECFTEAKLEPAALEQIAVGVGPGSFTGIRIAVNAARTLAYGLNKPVKTFNTLEILAAGALQRARELNLPILVLVNAQKNLMFTAYFEISNFATGAASSLSGAIPKSENEVAALKFDEVISLIGNRECLCVGDGFSEWQTLWPDSIRPLLRRIESLSDEPLPEVLASMALRIDYQGETDWRHVQPLYIRASEPEEKLKAGLLKDRSKLNE